MTASSESDFHDITNELTRDELQHLFHNLGIKQQIIEHAEMGAYTTDYRNKAKRVLINWKRIQGRNATREALLEAKNKVSGNICI